MPDPEKSESIENPGVGLSLNTSEQRYLTQNEFLDQDPWLRLDWALSKSNEKFSLEQNKIKNNTRNNMKILVETSFQTWWQALLWEQILANNMHDSSTFWNTVRNRAQGEGIIVFENGSEFIAPKNIILSYFNESYYTYKNVDELSDQEIKEIHKNNEELLWDSYDKESTIISQSNEQLLRVNEIWNDLEKQYIKRYSKDVMWQAQDKFWLDSTAIDWNANNLSKSLDDKAPLKDWEEQLDLDVNHWSVWWSSTTVVSWEYSRWTPNWEFSWKISYAPDVDDNSRYSYDPTLQRDVVSVWWWVSNSVELGENTKIDTNVSWNADYLNWWPQSDVWW